MTGDLLPAGVTKISRVVAGRRAQGVESGPDFAATCRLDGGMEKNASPLRWGILSTASIGVKNWKAIRLSGNSIVRAVASRSLESSRRFIAEQQACAPFDAEPEALGSYEALIAHPEVDAVYIPLPTGLRKEWVIRAAEAGKHVLSEKPCAVTTAELDEMLDACRRNRVQFMDGVMFMHNERLEQVRAVLDDPQRIGPVRRIHSAFSFFGAERFKDGNIRFQSDLEPLGCLGDLGWYCVRFGLWVMDWQLPQRVAGRLLKAAENPDGGPGCPLEFSGELFFDDGVSFGFYCSFLANRQQWVTVSGEQGALRIADFVNPSDLCDVAYEVCHERVPKSACGIDLTSETTAGSQEANMFRAFGEQVRGGGVDERWPEMARKTQQVVDACLASALDGNREVTLAPDR
ncbi:Gfo/Idh/MocA family protein [Luteolibacter marinus]|uniref:Gfo/Idh/MocA family protein n=1 Tax=Luteolibacter marinus TaxID=2776705 RepID=UPI001D01410B|nr:Gfo/Idh/MocA family oxidoreductase [Luteolibacter marinus]